jgi:hypothetical protein
VALISVNLSCVVDAETYFGLRAAALPVFGSGMVMVNIVSASGPVYGAGAAVASGAAWGSALLCDPPPPHAARETVAMLATTEKIIFLRSSRFMGHHSSAAVG